MEAKNLSYFTAGNFQQPDRLVSAADTYEMIRSGLQDVTTYVQDKYADGLVAGFPDGNKQAYQADKKRLFPSVCFAGNIDRSTGAKNLSYNHSGLINLDVDEDCKEDLEAFFQAIQQGRFQCVEAAARSVSGKFSGSLWMNVRIQVPANIRRLDKSLVALLGIVPSDSDLARHEKLHKAYHQVLTSLFFDQAGIKVGSSKDLKRTRYLTADPGIYVDRDAMTFPLLSLKKGLEDLDKKRDKSAETTPSWTPGDLTGAEPFQAAEQYAGDDGTTYETRHNYVFRLSIALNLFGVPEDQASDYVARKYPDYDQRRRDGVRSPYRRYADAFGAWRYKLMSKDVTPDDVLTVKKGRYLSDHADRLADLILKYNKVDLKADTGIGKNYAVVHHIAPRLKVATGCRTVIVCSLNAKAEKDAEQYGLQYVTGERWRQEADLVAAGGLQDWMDADVLLTNQDTFPKLAAMYEKQGVQVNVFLDESHTLTSSMSYKSQVIGQLMEAVRMVGRTVTLMSGTPKPYFAYIGFHRINVEQEERPVINLVRRTRIASIEATVRRHCLETDFLTTRLVVKIQSQDVIRNTKKVLEDAGFRDDEILIFYSDQDVKKSPDYQRFKSARPGQDSFADQVKVVLCTSVIGEGLDVYSSKDVQVVNIEKNKTFSPDDLVQFIDRWRTDKPKTAYTYHPADDQPKKTSDYNELLAFQETVEIWQATADCLNSHRHRLQAKTTDTAFLSLKSQYSNFENCLTWNEQEQRFLVNYTAVAYFVDKEKRSRTSTDAGLAEVSRKFPYIQLTVDQEVQPDDELVQAKLDEIKEANKAAKRDAKAVLAELFEHDKEVLLQAVRKRTEDNAIKRKVPYRPELKDAVNRLISSHSVLFKDYFSEAEQLVRHHFQLLSSGLSVSDAVRLAIPSGKDGRRMPVSVSAMTAWLTAWRVLLSVYLYEICKSDKSAKLLTAVQAADAKVYVKVIEAVEKAASEADGRRLSPDQLHDLVRTAYGRKGRSFGRKQTVGLVNILFHTTRKTGDQAIYEVSARRHFSDLISDLEIDAETVLKNLSNKLKYNLLTPTHRAHIILYNTGNEVSTKIP